MTTGTALLLAADGLAVLASADAAVRLIAGEREHLRLYGGSPGRVRFHRPVFRRVPGLPRDGVLTGEDEAAIRDIAQQLRKDRRRPRAGWFRARTGNGAPVHKGKRRNKDA